MTGVADPHKAWSEEPEHRAEYYRLAPEFAPERSLIEARPPGRAFFRRRKRKGADDAGGESRGSGVREARRPRGRR